MNMYLVFSAYETISQFPEHLFSLHMKQAHNFQDTLLLYDRMKLVKSTFIIYLNCKSLTACTKLEKTSLFMFSPTG
jgi:hypothetical protein